MKYYSTNKQSATVSLEEAVLRSLAGDQGLYMPESLPLLPRESIEQMQHQSFGEIAYTVANALFGEDIEADKLQQIVYDTLSFDTPIVPIHDIYTLELFHGPTLAFKDVGARFMARMLGHFIQKKGINQQVHVLVATSGDTGSAVANGFLGVEGIQVYVLYPKGKVSDIQESQFTTLGQNITAIEIDGTFDDCQALVKTAFADQALNSQLVLTSANSINVARFLPQSFYYFHAFAQLAQAGKADEVVFSVPSGNLGNLTAGLFAARMGLPVHQFIAANNRNDVFFNYLSTGNYTPRSSVLTLANAMDVGAPSNFARILDLYQHDHQLIATRIKGYTYTDEEITATMQKVYESSGYVLDPHGACGYAALKDYGLKPNQTGVFLETAHPAKFKETVDSILHTDIPIPTKLAAFMQGEKQRIPLANDYLLFKELLLSISK